MNNKEYLEYLVANYTNKSSNPTNEGLKEYLKAVNELTKEQIEINKNDSNLENNRRERAKQKIYTSGKSIINESIDEKGFINIILLAFISFFSEISFLLLSFLIYK